MLWETGHNPLGGGTLYNLGIGTLILWKAVLLNSGKRKMLSFGRHTTILTEKKCTYALGNRTLVLCEAEHSIIWESGHLSSGKRYS